MSECTLVQNPDINRSVIYGKHRITTLFRQGEDEFVQANCSRRHLCQQVEGIMIERLAAGRPIPAVLLHRRTIHQLRGIAKVANDVRSDASHQGDILFLEQSSIGDDRK